MINCMITVGICCKCEFLIYSASIFLSLWIRISIDNSLVVESENTILRSNLIVRSSPAILLNYESIYILFDRSTLRNDRSGRSCEAISIIFVFTINEAIVSNFITICRFCGVRLCIDSQRFLRDIEFTLLLRSVTSSDVVTLQFDLANCFTNVLVVLITISIEVSINIIVCTFYQKSFTILHGRNWLLLCTSVYVRSRIKCYRNTISVG